MFKPGDKVRIKEGVAPEELSGSEAEVVEQAGGIHGGLVIVLAPGGQELWYAEDEVEAI